MTRDFDKTPLPEAQLLKVLDIARRAPSAGFSQGVDFVVLQGSETQALWDVTLPTQRRADFAWPGLLSAPCLVVPVADPRLYLQRYGEADKAATQLGDSQDSWEVPYWLVDCAFAVQNLLLLAQAQGWGALFFGFFERTDMVKQLLGIPDAVSPLGAVALGHRGAQNRPSSSSSRKRRQSEEVIHWGRWTRL